MYNTGTATDNFTMSVTIDGPPDWAVNLCDEGMCYGPIVTRSLAPGEELGLFPDVFPVGTGYGKVTLTMTQAGDPGFSRTLEFGLITNDVEVLVVDDDWLYNYEDYYAAGLDYFGYTYGVWNRNLQAPTAANLSNFPIVMWSLGGVETGFNPTLTQSDRNAIAGYLNGGGNLFMTGQDLSSDMAAQGGAAYTWFQNYMHAVHVGAMTSDRTLLGVPGDPVSTDLDLTITGGDGAGNQTSPDDIDPTGGSTVIWTWDATHNGAVRVDTGVYKVVFLAFGLEAIDNASDRRMVLRRAIRWFQDLGATEDGAPVYQAGLYSNPNPVHDGGATLRFTLPKAGEASLQVFGPDGRWVRTLADGHFTAGPHVAAWDRLDSQGARVPAGVYWYHLDSNDTHLSSKTVVLR
jgi:flagellar hook assembly protein FlgD